MIVAVTCVAVVAVAVGAETDAGDVMH